MNSSIELTLDIQIPSALFSLSPVCWTLEVSGWIAISRDVSVMTHCLWSDPACDRGNNVSSPMVTRYK